MNTLEKIVNNKRLPVLFIGSGIPMRYLKRFPNWPTLLKESFDMVDKDPFYMGKYLDEFKRSNLSSFDQYKELGTIIENDFNKAFFDRKIKFGRNTKNPAWVKRGISPYKMYLRFRFKNMDLKRNKQLNQELEALSSLKNKVSAVITTNYDTFIETYILDKNYSVFTRQHEMFSNESYNISELYKIHGSITDVESIIITKEDYEKFNETRKLFIAKMLILFTESPIIFMGYSFTDENIQQIVKDFMNCLTPEQLNNISDNFIFISYKKGEQNLIESKRTIMTNSGETIPITEIETDNFLAIYQTLNKLIPGMTPKNIRDTQRLVKKIVNNTVISGDPSNVIFGIDEIPDDISNKNIAIAIGYKENLINQYGYSSITDKDIIEDIIFNNKGFNAKLMCTERFKSLRINRLMPVYKYIKQSKISISDVPKLEAYVLKHDDLDKIISPTYKKKNLKNLSKFTNISDIHEFAEHNKDIPKLFKILLNSIDNFSTEDLRSICKSYFNDYSEVLCKNPFFKRIIMYIDFMENYV